MSKKVTRRDCIRAAAASTAAVATAAASPAKVNGKPALLGGEPVRTAKFSSWPKYGDPEQEALLGVMKSGKWFRGSGKAVAAFEEKYARFIGSKHCLATANGTSALLTSLGALGVGPGDEVILPPYTFVACVNVIFAMNAIPVFVDSDRETFQIDANKIEAKITDRTRAIMPVHLGGNTFDVDAVAAIAKKHRIAIVEDACQSHMAEWKGRRTGSFGSTGNFSFQASKNLNCGEGGALLTNDDNLIEKCYAYHNNSRGRSNTGYDFSYSSRGLNLRLAEFQGAMLVAQMTRLEKQSDTRFANGKYLTGMLNEVPGIEPARAYDGCTRNAYHLYMFRYDPAHFAGLPRAKFLKALAAEGIPASGGYNPLNKAVFVRNSVQSRGYKAVYSEKELAGWDARNACPENDKLCTEAVWLSQYVLLGPRGDMDQVATAIRKVQASASALARA